MVRVVDSVRDLELVTVSHDSDGGLSIALRTAGGAKQVRLNNRMEVMPVDAGR